MGPSPEYTKHEVIAISEFGGTENFFEVERDTPRPRADEVLIRIRAGSFNPIDYKIRQGRYGGDLPMVLGHDAPELSKRWEAASACCELVTKSGPISGCAQNGANAEYAAVPQEFVTVRPRILSVEEAASVPVASLTANQAIRLKAIPTPNHSVLWRAGAGGLGSAAIQILQMIGVEKIVTTSGREASTRFIVDQLRLSPDQILHYPDKGLKQLTEEAIAANGWLSLRQYIGFRRRRNETTLF